MIANCRHLDDSTILNNLENLATKERHVGVAIIVHLIEVKARKLHVSLGHDGLFSYCVERLKFSKSTAYRRKVVVDKAEQFPAILEHMEDGRLSLCAAAAIAPHLTEKNCNAWLDAINGLTYREVESFVLKAHAAQQTPVMDRALQNAGAAPLFTAASDRAPTDLTPEIGSSAETSRPSAQATAASKGPRTIVKPLTAETSRLNVTATDATLAKLKRAREILRGKSDDEILELALDLLLEKKAPERRHARREAARERKNAAPKVDAADTSSASTPTSRPRQAPLADRDRAHVDAGGQCTFVGDDGHRCRARSFIESDHIVPFALGGESTYVNTRALCKSHNLYEAEQMFGVRRQA